MYVTGANKSAIKAATFAINSPDPGFKPSNKSFLFFFLKEKDSLSFFSCYLQLGITWNGDWHAPFTTSFFIWKRKKKFSIILFISRMTWRENLASERSVQSRLPTYPVGDPYLHLHPAYCFSIQEGCSPPPQSHSPRAPVSSGALPYLPPTIASPVTIIFLFHSRPSRSRGLEMETGFVSKLRALLCFLPVHFCSDQ